MPPNRQSIITALTLSNADEDLHFINRRGITYKGFVCIIKRKMKKNDIQRKLYSKGPPDKVYEEEQYEIGSYDLKNTCFQKISGKDISTGGHNSIGRSSYDQQVCKG